MESRPFLRIFHTRLNADTMRKLQKVMLVLLVLLSQQALSQSFKERLQLMQKEYSALQNIHMRMTIQVFENDKGDKPFYNEEADIKKQDQYYHYEFGGTNMLMNSKYIVMVDKGSREIVCSKRSLKAEAKFGSDPFRVNLDSILMFYESRDFVGKQVDDEHYKLLQKKGAVKQIDLFINSKLNVLSRIEYRYEDQHYVVIQFTLMEKQPVFEESTFDESQYFITQKGKFRVANAFAGYHLSVADSK